MLSLNLFSAFRKREQVQEQLVSLVLLQILNTLARLTHNHRFFFLQLRDLLNLSIYLFLYLFDFCFCLEVSLS